MHSKSQYAHMKFAAFAALQTSPVAMFIYGKHLHVKWLIAKDFRQVAIACVQLNCRAGLGACSDHATGYCLATAFTINLSCEHTAGLSLGTKLIHSRLGPTLVGTQKHVLSVWETDC